MKRVNWENVEKSTKTIKKNVRNIQAAGKYVQNLPEEGYMYDTKSEKVVAIAEAKSSSLRRFIKMLDNYMYLVNDEAVRIKILEKKIEIETELGGREDVWGNS